jgi:broad specificity phosphatase PhoE
VERLILARHGESELSALGLLNGISARAVGLTDEGRRQAEQLGRELASDPIDVCVVTRFTRTRETADLALAGRDVPIVVVPELNEAGFGRYEGLSFDEYRAWAAVAPPEEVVPGDGGESRATIVGRHVLGYRLLLERPEPRVLVVGHGLTVRLLVNAKDGRPPRPLLEPIPCAEPFRLSRAEVERGIERLEEWCAAPSW